MNHLGTFIDKAWVATMSWDEFKKIAVRNGYWTELNKEDREAAIKYVWDKSNPAKAKKEETKGG